MSSRMGRFTSIVQLQRRGADPTRIGRKSTNPEVLRILIRLVLKLGSGPMRPNTDGMNRLVISKPCIDNEKEERRQQQRYPRVEK